MDEKNVTTNNEEMKFLESLKTLVEMAKKKKNVLE